MKYKFAWRPDLPDQRDYTFTQLTIDKPLTATIDSLPVTVSLRQWCSSVEDQKTLGSCVANAVVGLFEYNRNKVGLGGKSFRDFSRLFNYYNARTITENVGEDSGTYIRDAIKSAKLNGICFEYQWPYALDKWNIEPSLGCYKSAVDYKVKSYYRLTTLDDMKTNLANGHPFVFGIAVYSSFISSTVANTGIVPLPGATESMLGGHAMLAIGYDDIAQRFLVRNSWGKEWGIHSGNLGGYCTIPYAYLTNTNLADDFWTAF